MINFGFSIKTKKLKEVTSIEFLGLGLIYIYSGRLIYSKCIIPKMSSACYAIRYMYRFKVKKGKGVP